MTDLPRDKRSITFEVVGDQEFPDLKRSKSSSVDKWSLDEEFPILFSENNPLNRPRPLGLNLKKSLILEELVEATLAQTKKDIKTRAERTSRPIDIKASNFPAVLLKIGKWEYVPKHEGDLVAKCYFAKQKLVWETLDGGLKSKIEMQWSDIVGLHANCPDHGPATLTIVLGKQPLFFRETNPQPRKHTLWQATCDFTNGEATKYSEHYLQCAPGVLNKHYEKLVQCDTRLKHISEQQEKFMEMPFGQNVSIIKDRYNMSNGNVLNQPADLSPISVMQNMGTPNLVHGDYTKQYSFENTIRQGNTPSFQQNKSVTDLVNHIGHCISEKNPDQVLPFFENVSVGVNQDDMLENICQILLSDVQCTTTSDEENLMSRVNSLCNLLQDGNNDHGGDIEMIQNQSQNDLVHGWHNVYDYSTIDCTPIPMDNDTFGMSRNDSFNDLLHQLPRITSLPRIFNDSSDDGYNFGS
uniref:uncharacterized protein LOC122595626 isoform X1 n=1 Tax=Erigeron canadensis TaxID=72917 RepID=UPI001CB8E3F6|nr:uncharacterized protein LOC122595626 isoform X1 [Erigeron canadensis]